MSGIVVDITGEYGNDTGGIHVSDEHGEIVMWDSAEWQEDPSLVFVIASAIREGYENGPGSLRARINKPVGALAVGADTGMRYDKCAYCHFLIDDNPAFEDGPGIARWMHLTRGTPEDEALDDHEPVPMGTPHTITWWKTNGPDDMKARFTS